MRWCSLFNLIIFFFYRKQSQQEAEYAVLTSLWGGAWTSDGESLFFFFLSEGQGLPQGIQRETRCKTQEVGWNCLSTEEVADAIMYDSTCLTIERTALNRLPFLIAQVKNKQGLGITCNFVDMETLGLTVWTPVCSSFVRLNSVLPTHKNNGHVIVRTSHLDWWHHKWQAFVWGCCTKLINNCTLL